MVFWSIISIKLIEVLILEKIPSVVQQFSQSQIWPYLLPVIVFAALFIHFLCFREEYGSKLKTMSNFLRLFAILRWIWFIPEAISIIVIFLSIAAIAYGIETIQFVKAVNNELIYGLFFVPLFDFYLFYVLDKKLKDPNAKLFSTIRKMAKKLISKQIAIILLLALGVILVGIGIVKVISAGDEYDENYFKSKGIPSTPARDTLVIPIEPIANTVQVNLTSATLNFTTNDDVFAVGNRVDYSMIANVDNANHLNRVVVFLLSSDGMKQLFQMHDQDLLNYTQRMEKAGHAYQLYEISNTSYSLGGYFTPLSEGDVYLDLELLTDKNVREDYQKYDVAFTVHPASEILQSSITRVNTEQIKSQQKSNDVIEGLSWIIVGWIPLSLFMQIRSEEEKKKNELTKVRNLLKSDYSMINRINKMYQNMYQPLWDNILNHHAGTMIIANKEMLQNFIAYIEIKFMFTFWDTLMSNGSLIKLAPNEIKIIQVTHDEIMKGYAREYEGYQSMNDELSIVVQSPTLTPIQKEDQFIQITNKYFRNTMKFFENVEGLLRFPMKFNWFDLDSEYQLDEIRIT